MGRFKRIELFTVALALLAVGFWGCAGKSSYVRRHPYLERQDREALMRGEVRPGFDPEMVKLAMGSPDNQSSVMTNEGTSEVWLYADTLSLPLFGVIRSEFTYVYFRDGKVSKVRTVKGTEKYQERLEKAGAD